jgi:hypothetical protein
VTFREQLEPRTSLRWTPPLGCPVAHNKMTFHAHWPYKCLCPLDPLEGILSCHQRCLMYALQICVVRCTRNMYGRSMGGNHKRMHDQATATHREQMHLPNRKTITQHQTPMANYAKNCVGSHFKFLTYIESGNIASSEYAFKISCTCNARPQAEHLSESSLACKGSLIITQQLRIKQCAHHCGA